VLEFQLPDLLINYHTKHTCLIGQEFSMNVLSKH